MVGAESLAIPAVARPEWLDSAATDPKLADYAIEVAVRSAVDAAAGVKGVQDRASGLVGWLVTVVPLALGATAFAFAKASNPGGWLGTALLLIADVLLIWAAMFAALAAGLTLGGGVNLGRMGRDGRTTEELLKADEADAWHAAAQLSFTASARCALDLFQARRRAIIGVSVFGFGLLVLLALNNPF